jgi:hypothetical protein
MARFEGVRKLHQTPDAPGCATRIQQTGVA